GVETGFPFWVRVIVKPGPTVASSVEPVAVVVDELVVVVELVVELELDPPQPARASAAKASVPTSTGRVPLICSSSSDRPTIRGPPPLVRPLLSLRGG